MPELNKIGIKNLSDLLNPEIYKKLGQILTDTWNEILYIDNSVNIEKLTPKQSEDYKNWINPNYWQGLAKRQDKKFNKENVRYQKVVYENSENIHAQISKLISEKWNVLTNISKLINYRKPERFNRQL